MAKSSRIRIKRIYEPPSPQNGLCSLVDRLWPRGLKKEARKLDGWPKKIAPSAAPRRWFGHDPAHWQEFQRRYSDELDDKLDACRVLVKQARNKTVSLLYAARDPEHNHALVLQAYLEQLH